VRGEAWLGTEKTPPTTVVCVFQGFSFSTVFARGKYATVFTNQPRGTAVICLSSGVCVFCELGTECLNIILINFRLHRVNGISVFFIRHSVSTPWCSIFILLAPRCVPIWWRWARGMQYFLCVGNASPAIERWVLQKDLVRITCASPST
jgi:hypothetical protein